jgi:TolA-binding protein
MHSYCISLIFLKGKESEVNNAMLKVKKIQKETKRQSKKICDQANYLKGRVETMTIERKETNESVHKLERQQLCIQREIEDTMQY